MSLPVSGRTRLIAHLGVPTESFRAPSIYNPFFEARGVDCIVVPMGCEAADFAAFLPLVTRLRNFAGALITMPHKAAAAGLLDEASVAVQVCGACNAVRRGAGGRLVGDMFDGDGFVRGVLRKGRRVAGASALVVGAGGAGSAIAASLAGAGLARLALFDADPQAAQRLSGRLRTHFPDLEIAAGTNEPAGCDIVVNATPLGMRPGDAMPLPVDRIAPQALVGDVVLTRDETAFLAAARARGCDVQVGGDMLFEQIPAYLDFFGLPAATPETLRELAHEQT